MTRDARGSSRSSCSRWRATSAWCSRRTWSRLYVCFSLMSFASYGLVVHNGELESLRAGRVYLALVVLGELMLFAALAMMTSSAKSLLIRDVVGQPMSQATLVLLLLGFGIKAGALPLHVWLPLAPSRRARARQRGVERCDDQGRAAWMDAFPAARSGGVPAVGRAGARRGTRSGVLRRIRWRHAVESQNRTGVFEHQPDGPHHRAGRCRADAARALARRADGHSPLRAASRARQRRVVPRRGRGQPCWFTVATSLAVRRFAAARAGAHRRAVHQRRSGEDRAEGEHRDAAGKPGRCS